ncbi:recombinase [Rhodobacteraceae bacterium N5(2021)]|uniref:Recombinase n=1 Tax=Gymnodinialimonas phycosphaerae TaxID=2841589 RepID=A0A975TVK7_9RHOB|nr:recombinase [Gymnodinialimonas phycosphaerae]MBY4891734.1 recombinase [Gymnodinialimonas phycosphaerae]
MNSRLLLSAAAIALSATAAQAQDCTFEADIADFTQEQIDALYDCVRDELPAAYGAGDDAVAAVYREWQAAATGPAAPGFHGGRFLNTFVNEVGHAEYIRYEGDDEAFEMPVGTVIAKESYTLRDGAPRIGPLFIMTRVATDQSPETDGWVYSAVQPNGNPMGIQQSFCHDCHGGFSFSDSLGYPAFDVRLGQ